MKRRVINADNNGAAKGWINETCQKVVGSIFHENIFATTKRSLSKNKNNKHSNEMHSHNCVMCSQKCRQPEREFCEIENDFCRDKNGKENFPKKCPAVPKPLSLPPNDICTYTWIIWFSTFSINRPLIKLAVASEQASLSMKCAVIQKP